MIRGDLRVMNTYEKGLTVADIWRTIKKSWFWAVLFSAVLGGTVGGISHVMVDEKPKYEARVQIVLASPEAKQKNYL